MWVHNKCLFDIGVDGIVEINKKFNNGRPIHGKDVSTVLANAAYQETKRGQAASVIRDIAGGHLFENGNKRTAQAVVEVMETGISPEKLRGVIDETAQGALRTIEDIMKALGW